MKRFFFLFVLISAGFFVKSQTTFEICVSGDKKGNCVTPVKSFEMGKDSGTVAFIVKNENGFGTTAIKFKIYKVNSAGVEKFDSEIDAKVEKTDVWLVQDVDFYEAGNYKIKVYNWYDSFIASALLTLTFPK